MQNLSPFLGKMYTTYDYYSKKLNDKLSYCLSKRYIFKNVVDIQYSIEKFEILKLKIEYLKYKG